MEVTDQITDLYKLAYDGSLFCKSIKYLQTEICAVTLILLFLHPVREFLSKQLVFHHFSL